MSDHVNLPWLYARTILLTRHGSHAYGTNVETSDVDVKGVAVPPESYYRGFTKVFNQAESKDPDSVTYDLKKFCHLASQCNPNIIEVLHTDESDLMTLGAAGAYLRANGHLFVTRKARHTFCGYAVSQMKRIKSHRRWLLDPPKAPPQRKDYGIPEQERDGKEWKWMDQAKAAVAKVVDGWSIDWTGVEPEKVIEVTNHINDFLAEVGYTSYRELEEPAARLLGFNDDALELLRKERAYRNDLHQWKNYLRWKEERNPARQELEARYGYDTKHGMHLVRLMRMCREILTDGVVRVRRPDAEELVAIRRGAWSYDELLEWSERQDAEMQELYERSPLPRAPDMERLDEVCMRTIELAMEEFGDE